MLGITKVMTKASLKDETPGIPDAPYPVIDAQNWPKTMMTLVRDEAVLRRWVGAFSVTYRGGRTVARPTDRSRSNFETNRTGRLGANTSANDDPKEMKIAA